MAASVGRVRLLRRLAMFGDALDEGLERLKRCAMAVSGFLFQY